MKVSRRHKYRTNFKSQPKSSKNARFATQKQHGTAGQIVPLKGSWSWRRQLPELPVSEGDAVATPKQHGTAGRIGPSKGSLSWPICSL